MQHQPTQRNHVFCWHESKFPALTAYFDACKRRRDTQHITGEFNRWLLAVAEREAQRLQEAHHATV